ncbi:MAG: type IX secretion system sortase PorU [Bacteroidales bacterium]|nr:type IX secretion system sortase PorU [Bacteroidales bacterium]
MKSIALLSIIFLTVYVGLGQTLIEKSINWNPKYSIKNFQENKELLFFENAVFPGNDFIPYFYEKILLPSNQHLPSSVNLNNIRFETINASDVNKVASLDKISSEFVVDYQIVYDRKVPFLEIYILPIRKLEASSELEKLLSFSLEIQWTKNDKNLVKTKNHKSTSVLASGKWIKMRVQADGVYKLTYSEILAMGITNPLEIRIFGNGGGLLPIANSTNRPDDLVENAILINKGADGVFNSGDYILFYATGPHKWNFDETDNVFKHTFHLFSDYSYYFVTSGTSPAKNIQVEDYSLLSPNQVITKFNDYAFQEKDSLNLIKSGSTWFWRHFDLNLTHNFNFSFPDIDYSYPAYLKTKLVARSSSTSSFDITVNSDFVKNLTVLYTTGSTTAPYANVTSDSNDLFSFTPNGSNLDVTIKYNKYNSSSEGWLNYITCNVVRNLKMNGSQMHFRWVGSVGEGNISEFRISNASSGTRVWDITDPYNVVEMVTNYSSGVLSFVCPTDTLRQFIAFTGSSFYSVSNPQVVANQNLHGISDVDLVIVTHPNFVSQANQLANLHETLDNMNVIVVQPEEIYNEFSSGTPDVTAIRDFVRMVYDKGTTDDNMLKYLLLFGDGSFDNRTNSSENTNFIITYQSPQSLRVTESFVTDDFFGLLDYLEGGHEGILDIGIGRLPVKTGDEASAVVNKISNYMTNPETFGDWRNTVCFIGDDEDSNAHMSQANQMATKVDTTYQVYNVNKIYLDSYEQVSTPVGDRYPDVNLAIENQMQKGALIMNYTGHGNEVGWAHEQILSISDINNWTNFNKLPLFLTATCEFSRYDDYERTSGGEYVLLNPKGGGIGLITTTRLVYSSPNFIFNNYFYDFVFTKDENGDERCLGDLIRLAKANTGSSINKRNFSLLGDPALKLAIPKEEVVTLKINDISISEVPDTMRALSLVKISGQVQDENGNKIIKNGILYTTVFDKAQQVNSLGNDTYSIFSFLLQNSILYKGKASINNGDFEFSFIVPKDITYNLGFGKISYYATIGQTDAHGHNRNVIIGGSSEIPLNDDEGPEIELYLNNEDFVFGGMTDENPKLIAYVADSSGINTVGNGIGHDITAVLDDNTFQTYILNEYYEADLDSYQSGKVDYNLSNLSEGHHKIKFKVWDVNNNSSEDYIEFIVAKSAQLVLEHVFNYPNPFTTNTDFYFDHNQPNATLDVIIQVFTVSGKLVKTLDTQVFSDGYRSQPINWDGRDDYGDPIGRGVYIYRIKVRNEEGKVVDKFEKLVILN